MVALEGSLGAGKSTFARGFLQALGVKETITSPTYTLVNEYELEHPGTGGKLIAYHIDLYRIRQPEEFELAGAEDMLYGDGIAVIEWSDRAAALLPEKTIRVRIDLRTDGTRLVTITHN